MPDDRILQSHKAVWYALKEATNNYRTLLAQQCLDSECRLMVNRWLEGAQDVLDSELLEVKNAAAPDWRIGLSCKPKFGDHPLKYERGEIIDVLPSGTGGITDRNGVLKIRMQSGKVFLAPSDEWVTA